jgi:hydrogenase expression/formation protein HypE
VDDNLILLGHGSGGTLSHQLLEQLIIPILSSVPLAGQNDAAVLSLEGGVRLAFTTDSYVVDPIFFPGGNIGDLAVNGTVNDLAMAGARPLALSVGIIIEEGFDRQDLTLILNSMRRAADAAGVAIITGDTKVVPRGKADRIFINTAGIGLVPVGLELGGDRARPGDVVIVSGTLGDHGVAVLAGREGLSLSTAVSSDCAALNGLVADMLKLEGAVRALRDPTRGGLATTVKEIARQSGVSIRLREESLPVRPEVQAVCAILGLDPLYVANEGKLVAVVDGQRAEDVLAVMHAHPLGREAASIGTVSAGAGGQVTLITAAGGERNVEMLAGEQLPRIC